MSLIRHWQGRLAARILEREAARRTLGVCGEERWGELAQIDYSKIELRAMFLPEARQQLEQLVDATAQDAVEGTQTWRGQHARPRRD